ncbi:MAG: DUF1697 domain-containing protein [Bacteroidetes bacterium]|nr:DUF1697 domain-containing protein [Bacteroidota bacterium]
MKTFLSILRGINVSGHKKIPMAELKVLYEELNFEKITTYIQSGNVIFKNKNSKDLSKQIEQKIFEKYNFNVPVIIRTPDEIRSTVERNPFLKQKEIDITKLHVVYLADNPAQEDIDKVKIYNYEPDLFYLSGKEVYLYCPNGYGNTKLTNIFFESKLKVTATTRNWNTTNELFKILKSYSIN